jgi:nucleoside-diphosphate-sugar epimerase
VHVYLSGASSFVGSKLASYLLSQGFQVTATYRTPHYKVDYLKKVYHKCSLLRVDISQWDEVSRFPRDVDAIIHVAGVSPSTKVSIDDMLACNVGGTRNIVRAAIERGVSKLIYISSLSIHGRVTVPVIDENTPSFDPHIYGASKYLGERLIAETASSLPCVALRLPGVLGEGAHRAWVPRIVQRMMANREIFIYNPDNPFNNALHVDDLGRFCIQLLQQKWTGFHAMPLGASGTLSIREVAKLLAARLGVSPNILLVSTVQTGFTVSSSYASDVFGFLPRNISEVLEKYAQRPGKLIDGETYEL